MNKTIVPVPKYIRFLEMWPEFSFSNFRGLHVIINKQITGCGFTEKVLRCSDPTILCSPRKMLMENKKKQHGDRVFLVINEDLDSIQSNLDYDPNEKGEASAKRAEWSYRKDLVKTEEYEKNKESVYQRIKNELYNYLQTLPQGLAPKIIVTYDSAYIIKKILEEWNVIDEYYFIVDEFQAILDDSRFKSGTEIEFLNILKSCKNVLYVSATPMLDRYLEMLDQFNTLDYYLLDWGAEDPTRIKKPTLKIRGFRSLAGTVREIVQSYLQGNYEKIIIERDGMLSEVVSTEAVFYVNSVNHIIRIIKDCGLSPDQVNILCSNTPENQGKINKKLGKEYKIGEVPTYGEPHKMFTFCTRTVYLGADFYSLCARSFIFSDSNSDCLSVDISMDLPQILGRQRLDENPWKNSAEFYYRSTCDYKKMTLQDLMKKIEDKERDTNNLLSLWSKGTEAEKESAAKTYLENAIGWKYKNNYVAVDRKSDKKLYPVFNNLVKVNELRTFEIQQIDYADRFTVITSIENQFDGVNEMGDEYVVQFFKAYDGLTTYIDRLRFICDFLLEFPSLKDSIIGNLAETDKIREQIISIGPERIKSFGYNITRIKEAMSIVIFDHKILEREIYFKFKVGERYTKAEIKLELGNIYSNVGYKKTAKANDIENYFEVRSTQISRREGDKVKRDMGFELVKSKQEYIPRGLD